MKFLGVLFLILGLAFIGKGIYDVSTGALQQQTVRQYDRNSFEEDSHNEIVYGRIIGGFIFIFAAVAVLKKPKNGSDQKVSSGNIVNP